MFKPPRSGYYWCQPYDVPDDDDDDDGCLILHRQIVYCDFCPKKEGGHWTWIIKVYLMFHEYTGWPEMIQAIQVTPGNVDDYEWSPVK